MCVCVHVCVHVCVRVCGNTHIQVVWVISHFIVQSIQEMLNMHITKHVML